jgi:large subunit ribosomal protein L22
METEVKAQVKYVRISPRKTRLVADLIRGMDVSEAENQLKFFNKKAAKVILKLLNSAVANALNNFKLEKDNLYIKSITVDGGPMLKRWQPRAFGRAAPIRKRSSHISIVLAERYKEIKKRAEKPKEKPKSEAAEIEKPKVMEAEIAKVVSSPKVEEEKGKIKVKEPPKEYKRTKGFFKKIFTRKSGM